LDIFKYVLAIYLQVIDAKNFRVQIDEHKNASSFPEAFHQIAFAVTYPLFLSYYYYNIMVYFLGSSLLEFGGGVSFVYSCCCS